MFDQLSFISGFSTQIIPHRSPISCFSFTNARYRSPFRGSTISRVVVAASWKCPHGGPGRISKNLRQAALVMRIFCFIDLEVGIDTQTCATSVGVNFRTIGKRFGLEHIRLCITQTVAIVFIQLVAQLDTAHHTMGKKVELFDLTPAALPSCNEIHKTGYRVHLPVLCSVLIFDNVLQSRQQVLRIVIFENQKYTLDCEVWSADWTSVTVSPHAVVSPTRKTGIPLMFTSPEPLLLGLVPWPVIGHALRSLSRAAGFAIFNFLVVSVGAKCTGSLYWLKASIQA